MRLSNQQRTVAINFFNSPQFIGIKFKYQIVLNALKNLNILNTTSGLRKIIKKYNDLGLVGEKKRLSTINHK